MLRRYAIGRLPFNAFDFIKYQLERFLIKGPFYQLLFIAILIVLVSYVFGELLLIAEPEKHDSFNAYWWAFLRLSDPGYLGDDEGSLKRVLSTILTILGYVLFMGSLVAIMTQWLYKTMKQLESGLTPITIKGHITILGYTNRTPMVVDQILSSKARLKRFLLENRRKGPQIAILNQEVGYELISDLKMNLQSRNSIKKVIFRTGNSIKTDDLRRVNAENSSVVVIPASIYSAGDRKMSDLRVIKTLMSLKNRAGIYSIPRPRAVVEILNAENVDAADKSYGSQVSVVHSRGLLSRMIAQNVKYPGLSFIYAELLSQNIGNDIYIKRIEGLAGKTWRQVRGSFSNAIPIGFLRRDSDIVKTVLAPDLDTQIDGHGELVFIAKSQDEIKLSKVTLGETQPASEEVKWQAKERNYSVLIFGWSKKAPLVINELSGLKDSKVKIDLVSRVPAAERQEILNDFIPNAKDLVDVNMIDGDYTKTGDLRKLDLQQYSNIVFLADDLVDDESDADARTILGYLQTQAQYESSAVLIELADPENESLFQGHKVETILSPLVISNILANVTLRKELHGVIDTLFNSTDADISFLAPFRLGLSGEVTFSTIKEKLDFSSGILLGVYDKAGKEVHLNPALKTKFSLTKSHRLVLLI